MSAPPNVRRFDLTPVGERGPVTPLAAVVTLAKLHDAAPAGPWRAGRGCVVRLVGEPWTHMREMTDAGVAPAQAWAAAAESADYYGGDLLAETIDAKSAAFVAGWRSAAPAVLAVLFAAVRLRTLRFANGTPGERAERTRATLDLFDALDALPSAVAGAVRPPVTSKRDVYDHGAVDIDTAADATALAAAVAADLAAPVWSDGEPDDDAPARREAARLTAERAHSADPLFGKPAPEPAGDHWQDGAKWLGPLDAPDAARVLADAMLGDLKTVTVEPASLPPAVRSALLAWHAAQPEPPKHTPGDPVDCGACAVGGHARYFVASCPLCLHRHPDGTPCVPKPAP